VKGFRLLSCNVQKRVGRTLDAQIQAIRKLSPDVVALQEVTSASVAAFRAKLGGYAEDTEQRMKRYKAHSCNMILSRWPLQRIAAPLVPSPERILSARVSTPWGAIELHNVHILDGRTNGWDKVLMLEGLFQWLASEERTALPRILCGDFNCPDRELMDGKIITSEQAKDQSELWPDQFDRQDTAKRWDRAERRILQGLAARKHDLPDVYRQLYLKKTRPFSPESSWKDKRLDHVFASNTLGAVECQYLHAWRAGEEPISDHSAMLTTFEPMLPLVGSAPEVNTPAWLSGN
jgi:endonuclease/exonuclease/phosphatase family metal-dependent hydrolase